MSYVTKIIWHLILLLFLYTVFRDCISWLRISWLRSWHTLYFVTVFRTLYFVTRSPYLLLKRNNLECNKNNSNNSNDESFICTGKIYQPWQHAEFNAVWKSFNPNNEQQDMQIYVRRY